MNFTYLNVNSVRNKFDNFKERINANVDICTYSSFKNTSLRNHWSPSVLWTLDNFSIWYLREGDSKVFKVFQPWTNVWCGCLVIHQWGAWYLFRRWWGRGGQKDSLTVSNGMLILLNCSYFNLCVNLLINVLKACH